MKTLIEKANILIESLPYIRNFYGKTFVIKYGGAAMVNETLKNAFAQDVVLLNLIGLKPVIVHGGGPAINKVMAQMGKKPTFIHGQRFTDKETIDIVEMVLGGLINKEIVFLINRHGGRAIGLSGKDGGLIKAKKKVVRKLSPETGEPEIIDLGLVGEVEKINSQILRSIENDGFIPNKLISALDKKKMKTLIAKNIISGGMLPKIEACINALKGGVRKTHIIDGRVPHALLLEIFTKKGIGTEIVK
ncbi:MAG: acetylglutamate kinase [Nitrospirae bacterium]|nr:acetylglutamate kinase [Nitrospirota bacterium]